MKNVKYDRLAQDVKQAVGIIIDENIDELDFVSIVSVELTKDLTDAKIYVQCMMNNQEEYVIKTLEQKEKKIKKMLAQKVKMRKIPNLIFKYDHSLDNYNHIDNLLREGK